MFEDPNAPGSDPTGSGSGTGGGAKSINPDDSIQGYTVPEEPAPSPDSGTTDTTNVTTSDPTGSGSGTGGG